MSKQLYDIKEVRGKDVTMLHVLLNGDTEGGWICAYVRLPNFEDNDYTTPKTYHEGDVVGVDTAHYYNEGMSIEEREIDAIRQIEKCIEHWEIVNNINGLNK